MTHGCHARLARNNGALMPKSKKIKAAVGAAPNLEAFSIVEFCARHCISRAHFYNMRDARTGPREMRTGKALMIFHLIWRVWWLMH
jgi:hypothetical protein